MTRTTFGILLVFGLAGVCAGQTPSRREIRAALDLYDSSFASEAAPVWDEKTKPVYRFESVEPITPGKAFVRVCAFQPTLLTPGQESLVVLRTVRGHWRVIHIDWVRFCTP